ncbi:helix-turn-helix transcriptional regulator [Sphingobium sp. MI1205]|uniref:helix-turn-helix transcriptional regulator n=1 Tax=Sphingobium sp. MI1205 TaxID=407020 RepID=UPI000770581C|nr:LuxR family transcriptional regulator [Sphingobium sp. MI1205]AMK18910.1 LuxR family transcriptional regulator [Sphingobium sp. MI1205]
MFETLVEFERKALNASSLERLGALTEPLARSLGFSCFTLFRPQPSPPGHASIFLTTYPERWISRIFQEKRHLDDPAHAAAARSVDGIGWTAIERTMTLSDHQRETLSLASGHGLANGITLPFRLPGLPSAMFSLAVGDRNAPQPMAILAARLMGSIVFAQAHRLARSEQSQAELVTLSPRQLDCIRLLARGMTDRAIADQLGLSPQTVREYVEAARHRYGVKRRAQLVAAAMRDGHLSAEDMGIAIL